jgi:hypothetical protein
MRPLSFANGPCHGGACHLDMACAFGTRPQLHRNRTIAGMPYRSTFPLGSPDVPARDTGIVNGVSSVGRIACD